MGNHGCLTVGMKGFQYEMDRLGARCQAVGCG